MGLGRQVGPQARRLDLVRVGLMNQQRRQDRVDTDGNTASRRRSGLQTFSSLKSINFRLLWAGSIFDNLALWLQFITLSWMVWDLTESASLSGAAAGLRGLPTLVIGPWAGVIADRIDRRKLVIVLQIFLGVVAVFFASMVATGLAQVWHVFAYASVSAVCFAFIMPARHSLIANTVPPENMGNAFALSAMTVTVNRLAGGLLGGLLITTVGIQWNFFVEAGAYIATALLLIPMKTPYQQASTAQFTSVLANFKDGFRYIWRDNRIILHLIVLGIILNVVFIPVPALLPPYSSTVLGANASVGGYLLAAQGVGGITATVAIASMGFVIYKGKLGLICLVLGSAAVLVLAQSPWLALSIAMLIVLGISQSTFIVSTQTLIQSMTPDTLRGRITSIYMLEFGLGPIAIILIGLLMDLTTVSGALTIVASVSLTLSILFLFTFRQVRGLA